VRCAEAFQNNQIPSDAFGGPEALDQAKKKAAGSLRSVSRPCVSAIYDLFISWQLAESSGISNDLRSRLQGAASVIWPVHVAANATSTAKRTPFSRKDAVTRTINTHALFSKWEQWKQFDWAIGEFSVWSEIHRLGSTGQNWKGKDWRYLCLFYGCKSPTNSFK
jgi:hypothetical protein